MFSTLLKVRKLHNFLGSDKNGILLPKLFWSTVRKNCSTDQEKVLKFKAEGREFEIFFEIIRTINSSSERSENFLVTECCLIN